MTRSLVLMFVLVPGASAESVFGRAVFQSPDGNTIAVRVDEGLSLLGSDGTELGLLPLDAEPSELAFSPDGRMIAAALETGGLVVAEPGGAARRYEAGKGCRDLRWSPTGPRLLYLVVTPAKGGREPSENWELRSLDPRTGEAKTLFKKERKIKLPPLPGGDLGPASPPKISEAHQEPPPAPRVPAPPPAPPVRKAKGYTP